jgi:hypothetical protein
MSDYFDDHEVKARITRRYNRWLRYRIHTALTAVVALIILALYYYYELLQNTPDHHVFWINVVLIITVLAVPVFAHRFWNLHVQQMEDEIDSEMKTAYEYRKRKHDEIYEYAHLEDTGEFVPEDDYPQKRLERR